MKDLRFSKTSLETIFSKKQPCGEFCAIPYSPPSPPCSLDVWCSLSTRLLTREALSSLLKPSLM
jgi:hypothetical protein